MGMIDIIGSQLDVASIVSQLMQLERQPVYRMEDQVVSMQTKVNEYQKFNTKLSALANTVNMMLYGTSYAPLVSPTSYNNRLVKSMFAGSTATSSNENVLTATAFGGLASMGSYSITVSKLAKAQTMYSSGYSDPNKDIGPVVGTITMADGKSLSINYDEPPKAQIMSTGAIGADTTGLGEGWIKFATENGSNEITIAVTSTDSLTDLADKINADPVGFFKASITDNGRLEVTTSVTGADNAFTVEMSDSDFHEGLKFNATQSATNRIATLRGLQSAINNAAAEAGVGINALIINDGSDEPYKMMIISKETGEANRFTLGGEFVGSIGLQFTVSQEASDAMLTINGIDIKSSSNTVKSALEGVDITLKNITQPGETITLEIGVDNDSIVSAVKDIIEAYNDVVAFINSQFRYDSTLSGIKNANDYIKSQFQLTEVSTGVLFGDPTLRSVQSRLQSIVLGSSVPLSTDPNNPYRSMNQVGISVDKDGFLSLDENQLRKALSEDFDRTSKFFLGYETSSGTITGGMLSNLGEALKGLTDPLRNPIKTAMDGLNNSISNVLKNIDDYERRLEKREDQLYAQFSAADEALRQMRVLLGSISSSLASLSNTNNNN